MYSFIELAKRRNLFLDLKTKVLNLDNEELSDLNGIENFTNLEYLNIQHNYIQDITPLGKLKRLKRLNITDNNITDISCLKNLYYLEVLHLENNPIDNIIKDTYKIRPSVKQKINTLTYSDKTFEKFVFDHENY